LLKRKEYESFSHKYDTVGLSSVAENKGNHQRRHWGEDIPCKHRRDEFLLLMLTDEWRNTSWSQARLVTTFEMTLGTGINADRTV
jgi:hypothetical protein